MDMTSPGQQNREIISHIYKSSRRLIEGMVETGDVDPENADAEWAKMVADRMQEHNYDLPSTIKELLE